MSKNSKKNKPGLPLLIALVVLGIAVLLVTLLKPEEPDVQPSRPVQLTRPTTAPTTAPTEETDPAPTEQAPVQEFTSINLGGGLTITDVGSYTGTYMEDGSDELVSGVMMIVVENDSGDDLQLADIELSWAGELYSFRLTDLPDGARAVLLEQGRSTCPEGIPESAVVKNVAIFPEPMDLCEDRIEVSGMEGMVNVKNVSGEDITGDIYVYYKYAAEDIFYGGITFRIRVEGGLAADEIRQLPAGHYSPERCTIVHVECYD